MRLRKRDMPETPKKIEEPLPPPDNSELLNGQKVTNGMVEIAYVKIIEALKEKKPATYTFDVTRNSQGLIETVVARPVN